MTATSASGAYWRVDYQKVNPRPGPDEVLEPGIVYSALCPFRPGQIFEKRSEGLAGLQQAGQPSVMVLGPDEIVDPVQGAEMGHFDTQHGKPGSHLGDDRFGGQTVGQADAKHNNRLANVAEIHLQGCA
ncbi:hypothetical protein ILP92_12995 [Maribius pontilimi]|uniref:Uncharacterized protein n=1 Tax=Palleronia pontilimi TaxID=1964209 RepID=A0A934MAI5_9RHOB|nr:hypothetical protein [Palleronia pontilimi]MBJ3763667.1 hypothetical protein [Palleronia pontilimi]